MSNIPSVSPAAPSLTPTDFQTIQSLVIGCPRHPRLRYHFFRIDDGVAARRFVAAFGDGGEFRVHTADAGRGRKDETSTSRFFLAFTAPGLAALGVDASHLDTFPTAFREGAAIRARVVGDVGPSAPEHWTIKSDESHIVVLLYANDEPGLHAASNRVCDVARKHGCTLKAVEDGRILETYPGADVSGVRREHFGFADGISQPRIAGVGSTRSESTHVPPGLFILGHPDTRPAVTNLPVPQPEPLGRNGTFGAFRKMEQDCDAFNAFLDGHASTHDRLGRERLAAKMVGRWRDGEPLALFPDAPPSATRTPDAMNAFDFSDDPVGRKCPVGAHIRRANPRGSAVLGTANRGVALIRRGMPYGPPHKPRDGQSRGILGLFLCASLQHQFEFMLKNWINDGLFARGLSPDHKDPLVGSSRSGSTFSYPTEYGTVAIDGLSQFVTTKAAVYLFFPSVIGIGELSRLTGVPGRKPPPPAVGSEEQLADVIIQTMLKNIGTPARRDAHPKHHGLVRARFEVMPGLPDTLARGLFGKQGTRDAYVRFSNGEPRRQQHDGVPDARGMAIKVMGVDGPKELDDERATQDFILVAHEVFFVKNLTEYVRFLATPKTPEDLAVAFPLVLRSFHSHRSPLSIRYFSQTPYALGRDQVVRYSVRPVLPAEEPSITAAEAMQNSDPNYLRHVMIEYLARHDAVFDFLVQPARAESVDIEDPTVPWDAPYYKVATVVIPAQVFTAWQQDRYAEFLSFNPWHCLQEHRPLGAINRLRKRMYVESSRERHRRRGFEMVEPTGRDDF